jgi:hypothetical protein
MSSVERREDLVPRGRPREIDVAAHVHPPGARAHSAAWTGNEMIVWGGALAGSTGGRYHPPTDTCLVMGTANAPSSRNDHTTVWTGVEMIVWGGTAPNSQELGDGGRYMP